MSLNGKHITFIGLNYAPEDTAIGLYSTQMVEALVSAGATVDVVTAFPYYPQWEISPEYQNKPSYLVEKQDKLTIYRYRQYVPKSPSFLKRIIHILDFTKGSYFNLKKIKKADLVISIVPFTSAAYLGTRFAIKHNIPHWIHIQDFEFDAAVQAGLSSGSKGLIFKQLFKQEKKILNNATMVSTISHSMIHKLKQKTTSPSYYLPNWIDENQINPAKSQPHPYLKSDKFTLLYSGNVGEKQDWDFFYAFAKAVPPQHYDIIIVGAGAKYQELKGNINQTNVFFYEPVPFEELNDLLCSADAHFLFQKTEVLDTVMPSKLLGMMASARPSLLLGNPQSEVKTVIQDAQAGKYLVSPDVGEALQILETWRTDRALANQIGTTARKYVTQKFAQKPILEAWISTIENLVKHS